MTAKDDAIRRSAILTAARALAPGQSHLFAEVQKVSQVLPTLTVLQSWGMFFKCHKTSQGVLATRLAGTVKDLL